MPHSPTMQARVRLHVNLRPSAHAVNSRPATDPDEAGFSSVAYEWPRLPRSALDEQKHLRITLQIDVRVGKVRHVTTTRSFDVKRPSS